MLIRRALPADIPEVDRIQRASAGAAHWPPTDYLSYDCMVAESGGAIAGFLVSRAIAGEREIFNLAVDPAMRRQGIAEALLRRELSAAASVWFLEVRASNMGARRLYAKIGFRELAIRRGYYDEPSEDAIVMRFFS
jgi:[ribosomal protein S18]-alanine N-acetyltransferase